MFRPASKTLLRAALRTATPTSRLARTPGSRYLSTAPPAQRSRGWKNAALRWGAAGGIVYWYNTTNMFAEELDIPQPPEAHYDPEPLPTIDSLAAKRKASRPAADEQVADGATTSGPLGEGGAAPGSPEELEQEADQQGAFNPETGEINWDCPCLGGMADGPCGENFKEAFSCFVFSQEEPKGVDCIEKFKGMQDCFRQHPDIYGAELEDDDDYEEGEEGEKVAAHNAAVDDASPKTSTLTTPPSPPAPTPAELETVTSPPSTEADIEPPSKTEKAKAATEQINKDQEPISENEELIPKAWHNAK